MNILSVSSPIRSSLLWLPRSLALALAHSPLPQECPRTSKAATLATTEQQEMSRKRFISSIHLSINTIIDRRSLKEEDMWERRDTQGRGQSSISFIRNPERAFELRKSPEGQVFLTTTNTIWCCFKCPTSHLVQHPKSRARELSWTRDQKHSENKLPESV